MSNNEYISSFQYFTLRINHIQQLLQKLKYAGHMHFIADSVY